MNKLIQKSESWKMFDKIARRYDMLNAILSFGMHKSWRKRFGKYLKDKSNQALLDLATGTAEVPITLVRHCDKIGHATGVDLAKEMLAIGRDKISKLSLEKTIELREGDAQEIPFGHDHFDAVTMSFGIRNVEEPLVVMQEMFRVLKRGGRAMILEFSMPKNSIIKIFYLVHLRIFVPLLGFLLTGNYDAYKYLNRSVEAFPYGDVFCNMMKESGFADVQAHPILFGVATIYVGDKE